MKSLFNISKIIFFALVVFFGFVNYASANTAYNYSDTLLIINDNSTLSTAIGSYFLSARPTFDVSKVVHINTITTETVSRTEYTNNIKTAIETFITANGLSNTINYVILTKGVPIRITDTNNSVDSELAWCLGKATCNPEYIFNPFYNSSTLFSHQAYNMYLVTRLDGYAPAGDISQIRDLIDHSSYVNIPSEANLKAQGLFVLDGGGLYDSYENSMLENANSILAAKGWTTVLDETSTYLTGKQNVIGYWSWGSNANSSPTMPANAIPGNTYVNGAIGETAVSTSARSFTYPTSYGQSLITDWIHEGISGIKGYVYEPGLGAIAKPDILFDHYTSGFNLASSYYAASSYLYWKDVVIGDPKMVIVAPNNVAQITSFIFSNPATTGVVNNTNHTVALTVPYGTAVTSLTPTISIPAGSIISPTGAQNFTSPVTYTVTSQDGNTVQNYTVTVTAAQNTAALITSFIFASPSAAGTVNNTNHTIAITLPYGTTLTSLTPTIVVSPGAGISPTGAQNFTSPVTYTVTSEDGNATQSYIVTVISVSAVTPNTVMSALHSFGEKQSSKIFGDLTLSGSILYGMTYFGGSSNAGTIFSVNTDGSGQTILHTFSGGISDGANPHGSLTLSGSILYGMTGSGGASNGGTIFSINTDGSGFTILHSFTSATDGSSPQNSLTISGAVMYGVTSAGGTSNKGTIFSINTDGSGFANLRSFAGGVTEGSSPQGNLTLSSGVLYGTTFDGGTSNKGTIFSINTDGSGFANLRSFAGGVSDGATPRYSSLTISGSVMYGVTYAGGANSDGGTIYSINTNGTGFTILRSLSSATDGSSPQGSLLLSGSVLYGTTFWGGASSMYGTIFSINTNGTGFTNLRSFTSATTNGANPISNLIISGSVLYGTTGAGGAYNAGTVFSMNTNGTGFTLLMSAGLPTDGSTPYGALTLSGSVLYGTTYSGGPYNKGNIFSVNTDGTGYTVLYNFTGSTSDGANPYYSGLLISDSVIYGMTYTGGSSNKGTIYSINTSGTGFTLLHSFVGTNFDGDSPLGGLTLSEGILYGTTKYGGPANKGVIFSINTNGTGFTLLRSFAGGVSDGANPYGSLTISGSVMYGMTNGGGVSSKGVIFSINTNGTGFTLLRSFAGGVSDGDSPAGTLILSGSVLYGTTYFGGAISNRGIIFSINTNGTGFTLLHSFAGGTSDGYNPFYSNILTLSGSVLYGVTGTGGANSGGVAFFMNTDGTGYNLLYNFPTNSIYTPYSGVVFSGSKIYGTASSGGLFSGSQVGGGVYSLSFDAPPTLNSISASASTVMGGTPITITPAGQGDLKSSALYLYCNETGAATSVNSLCTETNTSNTSPYGSMSCTYNVPAGITSHTVYCRTYNGVNYSTERTLTYTASPTLSFVDNVSVTPVQADTITVDWANASTKKWDYSSTNSCSFNVGDYTMTEYDSMNQTTEINNGKYICLYGKDVSNNITTLASAYPINIDATAPLNTGIASIIANSVSQLTITANIAVDEISALSGTPYYFDRNNGLFNSGWQASNIYVDTGLSTNTKYNYQVRTKDTLGNASNYLDSIISKYTLAPTPTNLTVALIGSSANLTVDTFNNSTSDLSGYYFERVGGPNSGWIQTNTWQDAGRLCATEYSYSVKYRNGDGVQTSTLLKDFSYGCAGTSSYISTLVTPPIIISTPEITPPVTPPTTTQTLIDSLTAQIASLQAQIAAILNAQNPTIVPSSIPTNFVFTKKLNFGMVDSDVKYLQIILNSDKDTQVSSSGIGSSGHETTRFGSATFNAVKKFQQKYASEILTLQGFKNPTGIVGASTIKKLNNILSTSK